MNPRYQAEVIELDGVVTLKVTTLAGGRRYLVGYFRRGEVVHEHGMRIDPDDIELLPREERG